ncbi:MAG: outer membrane beta-barrel protein [Betaproteobacteria bacterium]|nr:outer membrane beta-barrel protein [Betaproteobacteria bacterium]
MKYALKPLAACMASLFGIASFNAWGAPPATPPVQNQNAIGTQQGAGTPGTPSVLPSRPVTSVFPPRQTEFPGIPWGSFLVFPEVSLAATYDDNIYAERPYAAQRTYVTDDMVYTLSPSLALKSNWSRHALNFDAGGDFDRYRNHDAENVNDYWLGFDGRYDLSATSNVFGGARHTRDHEDRSTPGSDVTQIEPTRYDHDEAHLGVAQALGAFRLRLGGTYDRYDYKDGILGSGAVSDNDYRDHNLSSLGVRLGYVLSPRYELFGQVATDNRRYDNLINGRTFNRDSDGSRVAAGVKFTLQPQHLSGEAFAGVMRQNFDYSGFSDISKPYFGALAIWKPTTRVTATGFIDRSLEETVVNDGTTYASSSLDTTYGFEVERRLSSKLSVSGRAAYTRSEFNSFDRLDKIIDAGAGLRYYVLPNVYLGADLRIVDRASSDIAAQYSRNQVMASIGYTPARNRDYAIIPEQEAGAPEAPRAQGQFSGFYLGAQLGHGALTTSTWGPRGGGGVDAADMGSFGTSYALFGGWGTEIASDWYLGVELDGGDSNADWYHRKDKPDSVTVSADKDSSIGLSLRAGYLLDGGMLYGKVGKVRTDFHTYYAENQYASGAFDQDHTETGTRIGLGLEIPASRNLFVRTDYSVTRYGSYDVPYQSGAAPTTTTTEVFKTGDAVFSLGLGWRFGGQRPAVATRPATELRGLYMGADLGHGTLGTQLTGTHDIGAGDYAFTGDFARTGFTGGVFAGYGHTFNQVYVGLELEAEAANFGWEHERTTGGAGGRDFAAEKRGGYGGSLRVGYVLPNGSLLYGHVGQVQTRFNTIYNRGANDAKWINRSDTLTGTRVGVGAEIPASQNTFVRMDYSYTHYKDPVHFVTEQSNPDDMSFDYTENLVRLGLGYRF